MRGKTEKGGHPDLLPLGKKEKEQNTRNPNLKQFT